MEGVDLTRMMTRLKTCLSLIALTAACVYTAGSAHAALVVTDHPQGTNPDTFYNSLTNVEAGHAPSTTSSNRFSLDVGDVEGQSFTLGSSITLDSIYMAYNDQQSTGTFNLYIDIGNDSSNDHTFSVTVLNSWQSGGGNSGPHHMLQFNLSSENITLGAGQHSFSVEGITDNAEGSFLIAPLFQTVDNYAGGQLLSNSGRDMFFAVTSVPEPSSFALISLASLALLARRRH